MSPNLLPDYIEARDGKIVSGGHFDSDWNLPAGRRDSSRGF